MRKINFTFVNVVKEKYPLQRVDDSVLIEKNIDDHYGKVIWFTQSRQVQGSKMVQKGHNTYYVAGNGLRKRLWSRVKYNFISFVNVFLIFTVREIVDFVQVKDLYFSALIALLYAKLRGVPFFYWLSFPFPEAQLLKVEQKTARYPFIYWVRGWIYKFLQYKILMPSADHVFVQSEQMRKDIAEHGLDENAMTVVPMGYEKEAFSDAVLEKEEPLIPYSVAYLGTMSSTRHLDFLIRSFAQVVKQIPNAKLYMIGGGADEQGDLQMLKDESVRQGIAELVEFTGFMPHGEAMSLLKKVCVCVSPFYPTFIFNSTSPTKLVEYMALSKPCVANEHPEQKSILEESGGGLCTEWDETAFSEAVLYLLSNPDKAEKMGRAGKAWVEDNREYKKITANIVSVYRQFF